MATYILKPWQQFIVPFYGYNSNIAERVFIGTAFIVKHCLLITAGHNILGEFGKNYSNFCIELAGKVVILNKLIHSEHHSVTPEEEGILHDLAIFHLNDIITSIDMESAFNLTQKDVNPIENYMIYGFDQQNHTQVIDSTPTYVNAIPESEASSSRFGDNQRLFTNCIKLYPVGTFGNSGCPLFTNKDVYGMFISTVSKNKGESVLFSIYSRVLKASYIQGIISRYCIDAHSR